MENIADIKNNISEELKCFNDVFDSAFNIEDKLLKNSLEHVRKQTGKQLRPILVIYLAKLCGLLNEKVYLGAAAIEMLHTGSLIHDDVVDNTMERRFLPSLNFVFDNKTAILVGDYILTKSINFMSLTGDIEMVKCLTNIGTEIARGELLQLQRAYSLPTEDEYYEIIRSKTAILFSTCASVAIIATSTSLEKRQALEDFTTYLGMCFQIKDDILDYTKEAEIGKPVFNDIREGKITLPLIYSLNNMPTEDKIQILDRIKNHNIDDSFIDNLQENVNKYKGIEYAEDSMHYFLNLAISKLDIFDDSINKKALITIANYILSRKK